MFQIRSAPGPARWLPAGSAALLWGLSAASAVLWWLHLPSADGLPHAGGSVAPTLPIAQGSAGALRALGHTTRPVASPDAARRFQLLGVIAADSGQGSALLAVDGQPAKAFVQGQVVAEGWRLSLVGRDAVRLSADGDTLELALPAVHGRPARD